MSSPVLRERLEQVERHLAELEGTVVQLSEILVRLAEHFEHLASIRDLERRVSLLERGR